MPQACNPRSAEALEAFRLAELLHDLLGALCHTTYPLLRASGLWTASLPLFSLSTR